MPDEHKLAALSSAGQPSGAPPGVTTADRAPTSPLVGGDLLDGRYRLTYLVNRRGAVSLWRGDDEVLARAVAVRVLPHESLPDGEQEADQLLAAAVRSGRLVHAGAASTYDATTTGTRLGRVTYVVSEWVEGEPLTRLLDEGPLAPDRAVWVVLEVARVLAAAHQVGLAHGDLHPGDVILTAHGGLKVLDLEVRAALDGSVSFEERRQRDVAALGALLYAGLTGRWPFGSGRGLPPPQLDSEGRLCTPRQVRAGVPRELDALCGSALSSAPQQLRLAASSGPSVTSASDVVSALEAIPIAPSTPDPMLGQTQSLPIPPAVQRRRPRRTRRRRSLVVLAIVVVLAVAAWLLGVAMGRLPGPSNSLPSLGVNPQTGPPLSLASVTAFDPQGDGSEQDSRIPLAHDGDPSTVWSTDTYRTAQFGNLKSGLGLKVDLGRPERVRQVRLTFTHPGQTVQLRVADADSSTVDGFKVSAESSGGGTDVKLTPSDDNPHRYYVIWFTQLPQVDGGFRAELAEMVFLS